MFVALKGPRRGQPLSVDGLDEVFSAARARAGLTHGTCHELRHTCFTRLKEAGMAIEAIQAMAGHRSIASTRIYLHLGGDWLANEYRRAAEAIDAQANVGVAHECPRPAPPRARAGPPSRLPSPRPEVTWAEIAQRAPLMVTTMATFLEQQAVSSRPSTVGAFDIALRFFAGRVTEFDPTCRSVADIGRRHVEDFKIWQAARPGKRGKSLSTTTIRHRLGLLRTFFERIIEWGYDDAPARVPIFPGDFPKPDEPLPKFLDDPTMAKFMAAVTADPNQRRRLMIELLARTGMRVGELAALEDDAMVQISETFWLRIPVGKLHNDRYVPLHPVLVDLITDYRCTRGPSRSGRLVDRERRPALRPAHDPPLRGSCRQAGGHPTIHPHQLRHTLATQAINRGMSLEAIAALLGHRSMRMTMTYARISDRTVSDEYFRVTEAVEANYGRTEALPDDAAGSNMRKLAADHRRMLGNGMCTRPAALDCSFESACERCTFFETGPQFIPILQTSARPRRRTRSVRPGGALLEAHRGRRRHRLTVVRWAQSRARGSPV